MPPRTTASTSSTFTADDSATPRARPAVDSAASTCGSPRHFDYKPLRTEDFDGVWASAATKVPDLGTPTLAPGESLADLVADPSAFEETDVDRLGSQGYGIVALDQLAIEHILGAA